MTGLFGLIAGSSFDRSPIACVAAMLDRSAVTPALTQSALLHEGPVAGGWLGPTWQASSDRLWQDEQAIVWFDGELYNSATLHQQPQTIAPAQLLAKSYQQTGTWAFLSAWDGCFSAVLYDRARQQLHLIADRYGLRPLHWMQHRGGLVWSGTLKGFLALPDVVPQVDQDSVEDFLGMRYLMGDRTWLQGVECLSAATVLTWDARRAALTRDRYWHWEAIEPLPPTSDLREVAREAGQRLIQGMRQQAQLPGRTMLTFSAGLDSRSLFAAAIHSQQLPCQTLTFEKPGDQEAAIPRQLSRQQGIPHQTIPVNPAQWIIPQALATWDLEAVVPLNQLIFYPTLAPLLAQEHPPQVNFHGAAGGSLAGSSFFFLPDYQTQFLNRHLWLDQLARSTDHHRRVTDRFRDYYQRHGQQAHPLCIDHRIRRFSAKDFNLYRLYGIETRCPLLHNPLQELLYALPPTWRSRRQYFYAWMLLETFPEYYRHLPPDLQSIARPERLRAKVDRFLGKLERRMPPLKSLRHRSVPSLPSPLLQEPNLNFCRRLLDAKAPAFAQFVDPAVVRADWEAHQRGDRNDPRIYDILTLELWLQAIDRRQAPL